MNRIFKFFMTFSAVLLALSPHAAFAGWKRADTHNFIFYSSGEKAALEKFATDVEKFDALLRLRLKVPREEKPNRLVIYVLPSQSEVDDLVGGSGMIAGFYLPNAEGSYAVINTAKKSDLKSLSGPEVLFHEYAHHFMFRNFPSAYPSWFVEGFAEFVATSTIETDGSWTQGKPVFYRSRELELLDPISVEKLFNKDKIKLTGQETLSFYARSWLLVHMLSTQPEYAGKLEAYLDKFTKGTPSLDAGKDVFGDLKEFDKKLYGYMSKPMRFLSSSRPLAVDGGVTLTELGDVDSKLVEYGLMRRAGGRIDQARSGLRALVQANPANADALTELALAEMYFAGRDAFKAKAEKKKAEAKDKPKPKPGEEAPLTEDDNPLLDHPESHAGDALAEPLIDRALTASPTHAKANAIKGELATWKLKEAGKGTAGQWGSARGWYRKALASDPDMVWAMQGWYESFDRQGKEPPANASEGLIRAFERAPEARDIRARLAYDNARRGDFDEALRLVRVLAFDPHSNKSGRYLLKKIEDMKVKAETEGKGVVAKPAG